jgi:hypothetical protein
MILTNYQERLPSMKNRNYKLRLTYSDGTTAKVICATYSLPVSLLVGMKTRNESFTFTVSLFGNEMDTQDYAHLDSAVTAWIDLSASKAAMSVLDEARGRLYHAPITAAEAEQMMF